ncbi:MAG: phospho-N-acetylmuramoyl-pentapeptide-transferase [Proteobacteria bacterium]|nr:phospho-N-acetylmuramoyl-pentapeptide-transferase [Pseudomonadota bacterium]
MLYHIFNALRENYSFLNVFRYQTFRSMFAFILTFFLVLVLERHFISWFSQKYLGQPIREDGPQSHLSKKGTPTMGGIVVVLVVLIVTFLFSDLLNIYVWCIMGITAGYAGLGFADDYFKVKVQNSKGVSAKTKLSWQFGLAVFFSVVIYFFGNPSLLSLTVPFVKNTEIHLGILFIPFATLVIVGSSNAVNLTDGLDGLVIGPVMTVALTYGVLAYLSGNENISQYLNITHIAGLGELAIFAAAVIAGGLSFLWFNSFPAQVFMGDVGALALGGAIGMIAVLTKQEILLIICGGVFVIEALSVIAQVLSFKLTGKRIFKMAPIHHHFELKGIAEPKIIVRCWIISIVLAVIALSSLKIR